jgi:hypothetical protein
MIPAVEIAPLIVETNEPPAFPGSSFGTIHGFTQRGCTGVTTPAGAPLLCEFECEGLNASAVALALTDSER